MRELTIGEGEDGVDAKIQSRQALQGGLLVLGVLSGGGPATAHHTAGVHPAVTLDTAAPLGLWERTRNHVKLWTVTMSCARPNLLMHHRIQASPKEKPFTVWKYSTNGTNGSSSCGPN